VLCAATLLDTFLDSTAAMINEVTGLGLAITITLDSGLPTRISNIFKPVRNVASFRIDGVGLPPPNRDEKRVHYVCSHSEVLKLEA
jgi:hypothetical protein